MSQRSLLTDLDPPEANTVQRRTPRASRPDNRRSSQRRPNARRAEDIVENALGAVKRSPKEGPPAPAPPRTKGAAKPSAAPDPRSMPPDIEQRFVRVGHQYYFPDGAPAFRDRGRKLTTPSENTEVIRSLVAIAQSRGWQEISVSGTERFRKEAWLQGKLAGLEVHGHAASAIEQELLVRRLARANAPIGQAPEVDRAELPSSSSTKSASRARREALITGRLMDHGGAHYQHDPRQPWSYFVKIETRHGEREIWGVDLERAVRESLTQPKPGDTVGLRAVRQDPVTVRARAADARGHVHEKALSTHRNRWLIERRDFFAARAQAAHVVRDALRAPHDAVKAHPELAGTYRQLRAAELVAQRLGDPQDGKAFVASVRRALADQVARGEPLPPVRLRERERARPEAAPLRQPRARDRTPVRV